MFSSKDQYKTITSIVSKAFDTNLNKTRHKIARVANFDSAYQLEQTIPDTAVALYTPTEKRDISGMGDEYLNSPSTCTQQLPLNSTVDASIYQFTCTRLIEHIFQGSTVCDEMLLNRKYFVGFSESLGYTLGGNKINNACIVPAYKKAELDHAFFGTDLFLATVIQRIDPYDIVTDVEMLKISPMLVEELIREGSLLQFNFFCKSPELIAELGLEGELVERYISEFHYLSTEDKFSATPFHHIEPLSEEVIWGDGYGAFICMETPPLEFTKAKSTLSNDRILNLSFTKVLLGRYLATNDSDEDLCEWLSLAEVWRCQSAPNKVYSDVEMAVFRHATFALESQALAMIEGTRFAIDQQSAEAFIESILNLHIDINSPHIEKALKLEGVGEYSPLADQLNELGIESSLSTGEQFGQSLLATVIAGKVLNILDQSRITDSDLESHKKLFSALSKDLLSVQVDFKGKFKDEWGISEQETIKGLMSIPLREHSRN